MHLSVVSYRNSTSNHNRVCGYSSGRRVVSYRNSTSNHNSCLCISEETAVVSYRNSTSNHNANAAGDMAYRLYLIEILHQTTTRACVLARKQPLYLIEILHQTTTVRPPCIPCRPLYLIEILHQTTTRVETFRLMFGLYLIEILHQTTTLRFSSVVLLCCILSKFYIKPQRSIRRIHLRLVVSYRNSTSNHNVGPHID